MKWAYSRLVPLHGHFPFTNLGGRFMDLILLRILFVALLAVICYVLHPFGLTGWMGAEVGAASAAAVIVFELRVRALTLRRLIGAVVGSVLGIFGAFLFCLVLKTAPLSNTNSAVLQIFVLLLMTYVGLLVGAKQGRSAESGRAGNYLQR